MTDGNHRPTGADKKTGKVHDHVYEYVDLDKLVPYANNAKKHPQKQVNQIAASIKRFGFMNVIIVDENYQIVAGHGRYEAARLIGLKQVPVMRVTHLTPVEVKAYRLADNQLTMNTGFDENLLKIDITGIASLDPEFELEIIGLETARIDSFMYGDTPEQDPADKVPSVSVSHFVTKPGDIWEIGNHRLVCGDSREEKTFKLLMMGESAHMCLTDPPFNVKVDGHVCGTGKIKHDEFAMASGEMSEDQFITFLGTVIVLMIKSSCDGSLHYIFMDWRHIYELLAAGRDHYTETKNICVWNKTNGGMGSFYRSKHELVAIFKNGKAPHLNTIELGAHGRYRTNVWDYAGANQLRNQKDLESHPTPKTVVMLMDAIKDCTRRGHIVLDPFAGSGSTLIACEKTGRKARCIEYEPKYCDVIIRRWQELTGREAINATTGKTFNQIEQEGVNHD